MGGPDGRVEVVYALPDRQRVVVLPWREGLTAGAALEASGLRREFPVLEQQALLLGIYGRRVDAAHPLRAGDRVEIYRPLMHDPREARRMAAQAARPARRGRR